jgi:excisionase family DNA binding protein
MPKKVREDAPVVSQAVGGGPQPAPSKKTPKTPITCIDDVPPGYLLTTRDVASITHCSIDKVGEMLATGRIPGMKRWGSRYLIYAKDLRKALDEMTVGIDSGPWAELKERRR